MEIVERAIANANCLFRPSNLHTWCRGQPGADSLNSPSVIRTAQSESATPSISSHRIPSHPIASHRKRGNHGEGDGDGHGDGERAEAISAQRVGRVSTRLESSSISAVPLLYFSVPLHLHLGFAGATLSPVLLGYQTTPLPSFMLPLLSKLAELVRRARAEVPICGQLRELSTPIPSLLHTRHFVGLAVDFSRRHPIPSHQQQLGF